MGVPWPPGWHGAPFGAIKAATHRFPCVGAACAAQRAWHDPGTVCRAYRDVRYHGRACEWQHMCSWCVDAGAELWQGDSSARAPAGAAGIDAPGRFSA